MSRFALVLALGVTSLAGCGGAKSHDKRAASVAADPWAKDAQSLALEAAARGAAATWVDGNARLLRSGAMVFESSREGSSQLYEVPALGGPARRLVRWPSAVSLLAVTSDERAILFAADQDGDEHIRFYRLDRASGEVLSLTPDALQRDTGIVPRERPAALLLSARQRGAGQTSVLQRRRGRKVEYMLAPNEGHGFANQDTVVEYQVRVARFLNAALASSR